MTTPPVPDRLAEVVADAARRQADGEPITPEAIAANVRVAFADLEAFMPWAFEVAAVEYLERGRL